MVSDSIRSTDSTVYKPRGRPYGSGAATSDAVRLTREALSWTQQKMAGELECSLSAISKMEQEHRLPGQKKLFDRFSVLAKRAGVELPASDKLMDDEKCGPKREEQQ